jgi:hypothetical protein
MSLLTSVVGRACSSTAPGHAVDLEGVERGLTLARDPHRAPVEARVSGVTGEYVILALPGGPLVARNHAAERLAALVAGASAVGERLIGRFDAGEHQLLVAVDPDTVADFGTVHLAPASPTGAFIAFNLALPWHPGGPCTRAPVPIRTAVGPRPAPGILQPQGGRR